MLKFIVVEVGGWLKSLETDFVYKAYLMIDI